MPLVKTGGIINVSILQITNCIYAPLDISVGVTGSIMKIAVRKKLFQAP